MTHDSSTGVSTCDVQNVWYITQKKDTACKTHTDAQAKRKAANLLGKHAEAMEGAR